MKRKFRNRSSVDAALHRIRGSIAEGIDRYFHLSKPKLAREFMKDLDVLIRFVKRLRSENSTLRTQLKEANRIIARNRHLFVPGSED